MRRMKLLALLAAVLAPLPAAAMAQQLVYFGTRADTPDTGIVAARFDTKSGVLTAIGPVATLARATWLLSSPNTPILYSVGRAGTDGAAPSIVVSFRVDRASGRLTEQSRVPSGGVDATHLALATPPTALFVANYGSGTVAALPVAADGSLSAPASVQTDTGSGPGARQKGPHAHGIAIAPGGRSIVVTDLGADRLFVYAVGPKSRTLTPAAPPFAQASPGSGPRHGLFSRDGRFFWANSELTAEVTAFRWDGATSTLTPLKTISTLPAGYEGARSAGEIILSPGGGHLYATNRGQDTITVYRIDAATGDLGEVQRTPSGGRQPWALAFDATGRWLLVANESSNRIDVMAVDPRSGRLTPTGRTMAIAWPASIAFIAP